MIDYHYLYMYDSAQFLHFDEVWGLFSIVISYHIKHCIKNSSIFVYFFMQCNLEYDVNSHFYYGIIFIHWGKR